MHDEAKRRKDSGEAANQAADIVSMHHTFDSDTFFIRWAKSGVAEVYLLEDK